ncbi:predicted protein [Sclerotinia sclerotiorum 1980 UF-70]|uniref:Uncharacterized protein n=1 Tax=Sclerotinia sclerotiorum (strain ATCC 18683 / 1980 / Ss-1) TaxID=665079 RepID=A7E9L3_SCLS1|nr:predicted protein [Sclerotinia sclerotiorum 1980 UF-70]EDN97065.1 predicted protein [Sclerotinia sclerotiorum 1980 UF-70]
MTLEFACISWRQFRATLSFAKRTHPLAHEKCSKVDKAPLPPFASIPRGVLPPNIVSGSCVTD